jgi:DNA repair exonuclease SbcCD ATPase subunit
VADRVAPVDAAGFPSDADAHAARELGRQVGPRTRGRDELRQLSQDRREALRTLDTQTQAIQAVGAPPDVTAARGELAECTAEVSRLEAECDAEGVAAQSAEAAERGHAEAAAAATAEVNRLSGGAGAAREAEQNARRQLTAAVAELPAGACEGDLAALRGELADLEASGAERELGALAEDRALQARRERNLADLEAQIAEQVPPDARRPSAEIANELAQADATTAAAEQVRDEARRHLGGLNGLRERRAELQAALAASERDHALRDRLAGYLGQEGIQLDLVRQAEGRIIELANETLGRVSRGELRLEPPDPASSQALDLSVRRAGTPDPIPVGNLSGGQRCRVAVSLALAVCRFACGEAQPLESVVIDDAFANLDSDGRMAMIDVNRDGEVAGGVLRRIIVVSHHEDVSAAFPVGYRLENAGGATQVTRL